MLGDQMSVIACSHTLGNKSQLYTIAKAIIKNDILRESAEGNS